jgi:signal transduction histidine kinase
VDERLDLAYHGARAERQGFNISVERDFDPTVGSAEVYPQEITRVFLNLISNGFYAADKRAAEVGDDFQPRLEAVTRNLGDKVEIRIRDNGTGIPLDIRKKIFNPFFTTKPAGEGTGPGLSLSHDIVVKRHGGTIDLATEPSKFTEFIITLPRTMSAQAIAGGRKIEHIYSRGRRRARRRKPVSTAIWPRYPLRSLHHGVRDVGARSAGTRESNRRSLAEPDPV